MVGTRKVRACISPRRREPGKLMGTQTHIGTETHGRGKGTAVSNRYDEKIKAVRAAAVAEGTAAGLAEGRMQGLAQGRAEGRLEGRRVESRG